MDNVRVFREKNGIEYLFSQMKNLNTCTVSIMINTGSIYEKKGLYGGAHLLEHLLFKGNKQYNSQLELSKQLERYGAHYNAYTDTNIVSFHVKVQKKYISEVITILGNMVLYSYLRDKDIADEKKVVVQELERDYDNPAMYIHQLIMQIMYQGNNYGLPVGGSKKSVENMNNKEIRSFWKRNYHPSNIVVSIAGDLEISEIQDYLSQSPFMDPKLKKYPENEYDELPSKQIKPRFKYEIRDNMSQIQLAIGFPTFSNKDPDRFVLDVIKLILAGPMSSRLFVTLRTKYGLAYNVSCSVTLNSLSGDICISTGVDGEQIFTHNLNENNKKKADPLKVILDEVFRLVIEPVPEDELSLTQDFITGSTILETDDSETISQIYGKQRVVNQNILTIQNYLNHVNKVTTQDIQRVAKKIFRPSKINIALIGKFSESKCKKYMSEVESKYQKFLCS